MRVRFDYFGVSLIAEGVIEPGEKPSLFSPGCGPCWSEGPVIMVDPAFPKQDLGPMLDRLSVDGIKAKAIQAFFEGVRIEAMELAYKDRHEVTA